MDTEGEDKTADIDDSSSAADASQISELTKDSKVSGWALGLLNPSLEGPRINPA
jgi:hypothetical protein